MIWGAFTLLSAVVLGAIIVFAYRFGQWIDKYNFDGQVTARRNEKVDEVLGGLEGEMAANRYPEPPPLPPCKCGSMALLLLNGYAGTRIVACQECARVYGVNAAGVRFDRADGALPEYMTQRAMRELVRAEMREELGRGGAAPDKKPQAEPPRRGRVPLERPLA